MDKSVKYKPWLTMSATNDCQQELFCLAYQSCLVLYCTPYKCCNQCLPLLEEAVEALASQVGEKGRKRSSSSPVCRHQVHHQHKNKSGGWANNMLFLSSGNRATIYSTRYCCRRWWMVIIMKNLSTTEYSFHLAENTPLQVSTMSTLRFLVHYNLQRQQKHGFKYNRRALPVCPPE